MVLKELVVLLRVYEVETGKLQRCLKGFSSDDGAVLKVGSRLTPSSG